MTERDSHSEALDIFTRFLESKRLRKTSERFAILEKIFSIPMHFDVEGLYKALESDGYHVSLATVYNTVELLCECSLLRRHQFGSRQAQYELVFGNHIHLVCTQCGKIKEVRNEELTASLTQRKYPYFTPDYFSAYVYGLCSSCIRQNRKAEREKGKTGK